jgi:hypothetical protein
MKHSTRDWGGAFFFLAEVSFVEREAFDEERISNIWSLKKAAFSSMLSANTSAFSF